MLLVESVLNLMPVKRVEGITLIEVLIALLLFSGGLLAIAKIQIISLRWTKSAEVMSLKSNEMASKNELQYLNRI